MSDVTVVGLGVMGSALAGALLRGGHAVTVWNRTAARAEGLAGQGASVAADLASAVAASPVAIVCIDGYDAARALFDAPAVRAHLTGRVLVQLSTGTPQEARDTEAWALQAGAEYLDGAILAYPDQIGAADTVILVAGRHATFAPVEGLLRRLAGGLSFVGDQVGAASALDCASLAFIFGAYLGAFHGARICEAEGLRVDAFGGMMAELMPVVGTEVKQMSERIQQDRFGDTHSALRTYAAAAVRMVRQAADARIDGEFPAYAAGALGKGVDAGLGDEDLAAMIKVLRAAR
jgi:3-hydroxyisobutyrate dehydrogenase-like beta-hydroxyacid dehydrogenase